MRTRYMDFYLKNSYICRCVVTGFPTETNMLNFLKSITGKATPKNDKPEGACSTEKSAGSSKDDKSGGCCGGHCH